MNAKAFVLLMFAPGMVAAQGFAGLGGAAPEYAPVTAPAALEFPRDHGAHPAFRIEWWYLTAALTGADGRDYGAQWTLFRQATRPGAEAEGWDSAQVWMGHAGLTTPDRHHFAERFARGGVGQAGVRAAPFEAWIDDWTLRGTGAAADALGDLSVTARAADFGFDLAAVTERPPVPQGLDGFSVKSDGGQASYYYSQPFYAVTGVLRVEGAEIAVRGTGWLDREWSSQPLAADQDGWDWFSLHLDDGARVMAFRLRGADGGAYVSGTWIAADGAPTPLGPERIKLTPRSFAEVAGREVPVAWRVEIPEFGLAVDTEAVNAQSWMGTSFPYWEGPIRVDGSHSGRGYLEMTGY